MLRKIVKWVVAVIIIGIFGIYMSKIAKVADTYNEPKKYINISSYFSSADLSVIFLKEVPSSICDETLLQYLEPSIAQCETSGCEVIKKGCFNSVDNEYLGVFEKSQVGFPYIHKLYSNPEVVLYKNILSEKFDAACSFEKSAAKVSTVCIK